MMLLVLMTVVPRKEEVEVHPGVHGLFQFTQHIYMKEAQEDQVCPQCFESRHLPGESPQCDSDYLPSPWPPWWNLRSPPATNNSTCQRSWEPLYVSNPVFCLQHL